MFVNLFWIREQLSHSCKSSRGQMLLRTLHPISLCKKILAGQSTFHQTPLTRHPKNKDSTMKRFCCSTVPPVPPVSALGSVGFRSCSERVKSGKNKISMAQQNYAIVNKNPEKNYQHLDTTNKRPSTSMCNGLMVVRVFRCMQPRERTWSCKKFWEPKKTLWTWKSMSHRRSKPSETWRKCFKSSGK